MAAYVYETPNEKAMSGALALVMHALFFAMLVFSVTWQKHEPAAMVAELWSSLPSPRSEVPPPPPKIEPEPPKPQPKVEVKPEPKVEPKPQPKAEIDLREKKEKERKAREQEMVEKKEKERKAREQEIAEKKKKQEQEKAAALKLQQAKQAEAKRLAQEQADALKKLAQQQAAQAQAKEKEIDKYTQAIRDRIKRFIVRPPNLQGNPEVELDIVLLPNGEVLDVRTRVSSGQPAWDNAVERAIRRAQPLPVPGDPDLFNRNFREFRSKNRLD